MGNGGWGKEGNTKEKRGDMPTARQKRERTVSDLICFAATRLAVAGWLAMTLPSTAAIVPSSYRNDFRGCAGRLLSIGISSDAAANACAGALRPKDVSRCVLRIHQQTAIAAQDVLSACTQVRRPNDLSRCVIGISSNSRQEAVPGVLDYCRRSLLPVNFAECVVGLRREIDVAPTQAMESCINASDRPSNFSPSFVPQNQRPVVQPGSTPAVPTDQPPQGRPAPLQNVPGNQTPQGQPTPTPSTPSVPQNQIPQIQ